MLIVPRSRLVKTPVYLSDPDFITPVGDRTAQVLDTIRCDILALALLIGGGIFLPAVAHGILQHRKQHAVLLETGA